MGVWTKSLEGIPNKRQLEKTLLATGFDKVKVQGESLVKVNKNVKTILIYCKRLRRPYFGHLKSNGIHDIFVEWGEVRCQGKNNGNKNWSVGIENVNNKKI